MPVDGHLCAVPSLRVLVESVAQVAISERQDEPSLANAQVTARKQLRAAAKVVRHGLRAAKKASWSQHKQLIAAKKASWRKHEPIACAFKPANKKISADLKKAIKASDAALFAQDEATRAAALATGTLATQIATTRVVRQRAIAVYVCENCHENFKALRGNARYCCPACKQDAYRVRKAS